MCSTASRLQGLSVRPLRPPVSSGKTGWLFHYDKDSIKVVANDNAIINSVADKSADEEEDKEVNW